MKRNICDNCIVNESDYKIVYSTKKDTEFESPIKGKVSGIGEKLKIYNEECDFTVNLKNIEHNLNVGSKVREGDSIGKASEDKVILTITTKWGHEQEIERYLDNSACKKEEEKSSTEKTTGSNKTKKESPPGVRRWSDVVAYPFKLLNKGIGALTPESEEERTNLLEDISRIKQLMK